MESKVQASIVIPTYRLCPCADTRAAPLRILFLRPAVTMIARRTLLRPPLPMAGSTSSGPGIGPGGVDRMIAPVASG